MHDRIHDILDTPIPAVDPGAVIGHSREGRPIRALRAGHGALAVSLIGGCHADEPVGPRFLRHFGAYLAALPPDDVLLRGCTWWVAPHVNPDGEERNRAWQGDSDGTYDIADYVNLVAREPPGDDMEFGFPRDADDRAARPENRALAAWWRSAGRPFALHATLHGMAFAGGPWFLVDEAWKDRCVLLKRRCATRTASLGYVLHDVERRGEKGFVRLERGFTTRPDSANMRKHFLALGDEETAARFRPSSMEAIRSLGGDPLTLVSEMPLFITPGVGEERGPPDAAAEAWKRRIDGWGTALRSGGDAGAVRRDAADAGLRAMPVRDQMDLQWAMIAGGIEQAAAARS
jgi:hypothetical protein